MSDQISTGVWLARALCAYGVEIVFGIPGVHTIELYRGLAGSPIRHVTPRHEQAAGFMADGYARACGKPGVCFIISGPGMTNILTAMGQAYAESVPMLVISTVNAHGRLGSGEGWLHELPDQRAMVAGVAAFSRTIHTPAELPGALAQAFAVFGSGRPRPVHLELPIDVMLAPFGAPMPSPVPIAPPAPRDCTDAAQMLARAATPVILAGGGARRADIRALAERLDAPAVLTVNARGLLSPDHPLNVSLSPSQPEVRAMLAAADVVLAAGTEFGSTDYDMYEDGGLDIPGALIRLDIDPVQTQRKFAPAVALVGDAGAGVDALIGAIAPRSNNGAARAGAARAGLGRLPLEYRGDIALLEMVREALPSARIIGDSTQAIYAGNLGFAAGFPGGYANSATGFGTLGWGLPAAIGAALAEGRRVVGVVGDGGLQYCLAELASAVEAGVDLTLLVYDNQGYGEIRSSMIAQNVPPLGVDILTPDLAAIARACGWTVSEPDAPDALRLALAQPGCHMVRYTERLRAAFQARLQAGA